MIIYKVYHYEIVDEYFADSSKAWELNRNYNVACFVEEIEVKN